MTAEQLSKLNKLTDRWANDPLSEEQEYSMLTDAMELVPELLSHIKVLTAERDAALKACAQKDDALQDCSQFPLGESLPWEEKRIEQATK